MSKDLPAKYYQNSKERLQRKSRERYQSQKKSKSAKMVAKDIKISLKMKNKGQMNIKKDTMKYEKIKTN